MQKLGTTTRIEKVNQQFRKELNQREGVKNDGIQVTQVSNLKKQAQQLIRDYCDKLEPLLAKTILMLL